MNTNTPQAPKNIIANSTLLALYLLLASHFFAPLLNNYFAFSFDFSPLTIFTFSSFFTSAFMESNPWILIFDLFPHFFFGFDVETAIGTKKYAAAIFLSSFFSNILTILTIFILTQFYDLLPSHFYFTGSSPIVLLCVTCFCIFFNAPIFKFTNIGSFVFLGFIFLYSAYGIYYHFSVIIQLIFSIFVNFFVLKWIDHSISLSKYLSVFIPHTSDNNYGKLSQDQETNDDHNSIFDN